MSAQQPLQDLEREDGPPDPVFQVLNEGRGSQGAWFVVVLAVAFMLLWGTALILWAING